MVFVTLQTCGVFALWGSVCWYLSLWFIVQVSPTSELWHCTSPNCSSVPFCKKSLLVLLFLDSVPGPALGRPSPPFGRQEAPCKLAVGGALGRRPREGVLWGALRPRGGSWDLPQHREDGETGRTHTYMHPRVLPALTLSSFPFSWSFGSDTQVSQLIAFCHWLTVV